MNIPQRARALALTATMAAVALVSSSFASGADAPKASPKKPLVVTYYFLPG